MLPRSCRERRDQSLTSRLVVLAVAVAVVLSGVAPFVVGVATAASETEPNNTLETATPLALGETVRATVTPYDDDYFSFDVAAGQRVRVDAQMTSRDSFQLSALQVRSYDTEGRLVNTGGITLAAATTGFLAQEAGTYTVAVVNNFNVRAIYELTVTTGPVADAFEPNDELGAATPIVAGGSYDGFAYYGDTDYYVYQATAGETVTVTLQNRETAGFRGFSLNRDCGFVTDCATLAEDQFGTGVTASSAQPGESTSLTVNVTAAGAIYVGVGSFAQPDLVADYDGNPYTLSVPVPGGSTRDDAADLGYVAVGGPGNATTGDVDAGASQWVVFDALAGFPAEITLDATDGTTLGVRVLRGETVLATDDTSAGPVTLGVETGPAATFGATNQLAVEVTGEAEGGAFTLTATVPNDAFEPNDDRETATPLPLTAPSLPSGSVPTPGAAPLPIQFGIAPGDADWFVVDVPTESRLRVGLSSRHADNAGGSVQVTVFDESQVVLAADNTQESALVVESEPTEGTIYVRVNGAAGAYGGYGLFVNATAEPVAANDLYDTIARNDDPASATDIGIAQPGGVVGLPDPGSSPLIDPGDVPPGLVPGQATVEPGDDDWFAVEVFPGEFPVVVTVTPLDGTGDYSLTVQRGDGSIEETVRTGGEASLTFETGAFVPGTVTPPEVVGLGVTDATGTRNFTLTVAVPDDGFEENDVASTAAPLPAQETDVDTSGSPGGSLASVLAVAVDGDPDWYVVTPPAGRPFLPLFEADSEAATLAVFDTNLTRLQLREDGTLRSDGSPYYVRVVAAGDPVLYSLGVVYDDETEPLPPNDPYEVNDDRASATPLEAVAPGAVIGLPGAGDIGFPIPVGELPPGFAFGQARLEPTDRDWFAVDAARGPFPVDVDVTVLDGTGTYDLRVTDGDGDTLAEATGVAGDTRLTVETPAFGSPSGTSALTPGTDRYYVELVGATGSVNYSLAVGITEDLLEPNDTPATATPATVGDSTSSVLPPDARLAVAAPGDPDWYRFDVPAYRLVTVAPVAVSGATTVTVFDADGFPVTLRSDGTFVTDGRPYTARVLSADGESAGYVFAATADPTPLPNDYYEVNDARTSATPLGTASLSTPVGLPDPTTVPFLPAPVSPVPTDDLPYEPTPGVAVAGSADGDWYLVETVGGDEVVVTVDYDETVGSLSLALFDAAGVQLASGTDAGGETRAVASSGAPVLVRVTGGSLPVEYTLDATVRLALAAGAPVGGSDGGSGGGGGSSAPTLPPATTPATGDLADGHVEFTFGGGTGVLGASVTASNTTGEVSVEELSGLPADVPAPSGDLLRVFEVTAPVPADGTATLSLTVSRTLVAAFGTSPDDLVVQHYVDGAWEPLPTSVTQDGATYVVTAETTGFSPFALTEVVATAAADGGTTDDEAGDGSAEGDSTDGATDDDTAEAGSTDDDATGDDATPDAPATTETTAPGFGLLAAALAVLAVAGFAVLFGHRRRVGR